MREYYAGSTDWDSATLVEVTLGVDTPNIDFTLDVGGSIFGKVTEADGTTAIANASVWANRDGGGGFGSTRTASDGTYTITGLASGNYRVQVRAEGFVQEYYAGTTDWDLATLVEVTLGVETPGIDFTLDVGGSISGVVYEADSSTPVANAWVWADRDGGGGGNGASTQADGTYTIIGLPGGNYRSTPVANAWVWADRDGGGGDNGASTKADGIYTITGLPDGSYRVQAQAEWFVPEYYAGTTDWDSATLVEVTLGVDTPNIDFALDAAGSISGKVIQADGVTAIENARVFARPYDTLQPRYVVFTRGDGTYTITGLPLGDYQVIVTARDQGFVFERYEETIDPDAAARVTVTAGSNTPDIDFTLELGGSVSGTVYEADGITPIPSISVVAQATVADLTLAGTRSGEDGTYTIMGVPAGEVRVFARDLVGGSVCLGVL